MILGGRVDSNQEGGHQGAFWSDGHVLCLDKGYNNYVTHHKNITEWEGLWTAGDQGLHCFDEQVSLTEPFPGSTSQAAVL